jgi:endonuclease/exonuclease/phosphatase family metal-dependent hydrolase
MRLVSFNIFEGFRPGSPSPGERRLIDRERMSAAQVVVADLAPDILVVNEALFCRQFAGRAVDYRAVFGFPFETAALYDEAWGNAILSRFPIVSSREMRIYNRGGLISTMTTAEGTLSVASYHPHPHRYPENKAVDFTQLLEGVTGPSIVCGDLNCISPEDPIDRRRLVEAFCSFSDNPEAVVERFIESGKHVFAALGRLGFRDAVPVAGRRFTIPTDLINADKSSGMRIDHILANAHIEIEAGEVVHTAASNRASDHHPVMVDFRIAAVESRR